MLKSMFNFMPWGKTTNPVESDFQFHGDIRGYHILPSPAWDQSCNDRDLAIKSKAVKQRTCPIREGKQHRFKKKLHLIQYIYEILLFVKRHWFDVASQPVSV